MPTVSVIYPRQGSAGFDFDYYTAAHLPLLTKRWGDAGLVGVQALRGVATPDGQEPPYLAMALLRFASIEALQAAMTGAHAPEIIGDITNFTSVQPHVQINDEIG